MPTEDRVIETVEIEFEKKILDALTSKAETNRRTPSAHLNHILEAEFFNTSNRLCTVLQAKELVGKAIVDECRGEGAFVTAIKTVSDRIDALEKDDG